VKKPMFWRPSLSSGY